MNCASTKLCSQSCVWKAKCRHIKCSASTCNQVCTNCTMECVKGVERCDQMCLGGECRMECFAQHCKRQCVKGKCYYIGQSQSKAPIIYGWIWIFTTGVFMLLLNAWKIHNLRKQADISRGHHWFYREIKSDQWELVLLIGWSKFSLTSQKHFPDLGSDTSSVWNFCTRSLDGISRGSR